MTQYQIPAVCPTCKAVFPSGVVVGEGSTIVMENCSAGPCPNGHMGIVLDGTYSAVDRLHAYFRSPEALAVAEHIKLIAKQIADNEKTPDAGLSEITDLLPKDVGAAVKKLGSHNPITALLIVLAVIGSIVGIGANVATAYKSLSPTAPVVPPIIINANPTMSNQQVVGETTALPLKREQLRRIKQMEARKEKAAKKTTDKLTSHTKTECRSKKVK